MRRLVVFFLAVLVAGLPARAEEPADAIQAVIAVVEALRKSSPVVPRTVLIQSNPSGLIRSTIGPA